MLSWLAKQLLRYNMKRLNAGDPGPTLRLDAEDVRFRFPGDSSRAGEFHGKRELRPWLERFARFGLQIFADEVVVNGFLWNALSWPSVEPAGAGVRDRSSSEILGRTDTNTRTPVARGRWSCSSRCTAS